MSAREQVLMKIIANLRRFGIDISNSKFKDKDIENEVVMTVYIKDVREYMACYDFIRLEQTLNNSQWSAAIHQLTGWRRMPESLELIVSLNLLMESGEQ